MESQKIDMFLSTMASKFPSEKITVVKEKLESLDDSKLTMVQSLEYKDPTTMLLVSIFLGGFGVDRFMMKQTGLGVAKLLTCGGCYIWSLIDIFTAMKRAREYNFNLFMMSMM